MPARSTGPSKARKGRKFLLFQHGIIGSRAYYRAPLLLKPIAKASGAG